jgi:hypothetical protein
MSLSLHLSLCVLSPANPSFNGIHKVMKFYYCHKLNGHTCADFGCTHPIDGLFWSLPIYLLGSLSKYECWVTDLINASTSFLFFLGCHLPLFVSQGFISFLNEICLINIQIISFIIPLNLIK